MDNLQLRLSLIYLHVKLNLFFVYSRLFVVTGFREQALATAIGYI